MRRLEVEVVAGAVEARRHEVDAVDAVLLPVGLRADEERALGGAVRRVRLFGVAVPELVLAERHRRVLRVDADRADGHELVYRVQARELEDVSSHHEVRVPEAPGVGSVRADAADLGGEVEDHPRPGLVEEPLGLLPARQVVVAAARDDDVVAVGAQPLDEVRAEEPAAAGDEDPRHLTAATEVRSVRSAK